MVVDSITISIRLVGHLSRVALLVVVRITVRAAIAIAVVSGVSAAPVAGFVAIHIRTAFVTHY